MFNNKELQGRIKD